MSSNIPVLIVGAGPAGLVVALSLAQNGVKVRIIDKDVSFHAGSRGFGIQPRTYELFQSIGILPDVQTLATEIPTMRAYKLPGGVIPAKTWDLYEKAASWPDRPFGNGTCLSQSILEEIIRNHLVKLGVNVELGTELVDVKQSENEVKCTLVHASLGGKQEIVDAEYLIGSDGAKGSTRKLLGLTFQGETRDADGMVWGDVEIHGLESDFWHLWGKPGHFTIMARPLSPNGNTFGVGVTGQNFDPTGLGEPEKLKEFIKTETGRTDLEFGDFSWLSYFKPNMRIVNKFEEGRAFVVGDSAHVHSPTGGQGMNCSVQDSSNLAWKLALVIKGLAPRSLLSTYNSERLPVITQMLHATTALYTHTVAKEKQADAPETKEDAKSTGWFRWRNDALQMYGINYRFSDIVVDERRAQPLDLEDARARAYGGYEGLGTLQAGDRAPDAPGLVSNGSEISLSTLFKSSAHTVLIFAVEGKDDIVKDVLIACSKYPTDVMQTFVISELGVAGFDTNHTLLVDRDGYGHKNYFVEKGEVDVVLVRPDTFIGAIVKNGEGVHHYFSKILKSHE